VTAPGSLCCVFDYQLNARNASATVQARSFSQWNASAA